MKNIEFLQVLMDSGMEDMVGEALGIDMKGIKKVANLSDAIFQLLDSLKVDKDTRIKTLTAVLKAEISKNDDGVFKRKPIQQGREDFDEAMFFISMIGDVTGSFDKKHLLEKTCNLQQIIAIGGDDTLQKAKHIADQLNKKEHQQENTKKNQQVDIKTVSSVEDLQDIILSIINKTNGGDKDGCK